MNGKLFVAVTLIACGASAADRLPTMGWSSWNAYRVNISEELIRKQADAMVSGGFAAAGYQYVNIDDGWFGGRDARGRHTFNPVRFPNGLKPVVDYIHAKGLKAGIYSDAGENTCGSMFDNDKLGVKVGFYGHDAEDADFYFDELGFDFIKVDFGGGLPQGNSTGRWLDKKERYTAIDREIARVARKTGRDIRMNICCWGYPGDWVLDLEVAGSWRMSGDIAPNWQSVKDIIAKNTPLASRQRPGRYNDMDMLEVGRGMTQEEDKTHFGMWCMMASPLIIGCDLTMIGPETAALLKNADLIAIDQDPLGLQARLVREDVIAKTAVYVKELAPADAHEKAVALYNASDAAHEIVCDFGELGYRGLVKVRDCFEQHDLADARERIAVRVPAHGTRIYRLRPANK